MSANARSHLPADMTVQRLADICRELEKSIAAYVPKKSRLGANLGEMKLLADFRFGGDEVVDPICPTGVKLDVAYAGYLSFHSTAIKFPLLALTRIFQ
jgi:hypothetical protein